MEHDEAVERTSPPASCFWCERLHPGEHALSHLSRVHDALFDDAIA